MGVGCLYIHTHHYCILLGVQTSQASHELLEIESLKARLEIDFKRARAELELNIKLVY